MKFSVAWLIVCISFMEIHSQSLVPDPNLWVPNTTGSVRALIVNGDYTYMGGGFNFVGPNTGKGAKITKTSTAPDMNFPKVNGNIFATAVDAQGRWYIGGNFTKVGSLDVSSIARINSDGSVDTSWNPKATYNNNTAGTINAMAISGDHIYIGGGFQTLNGSISRNSLAKISLSDGTVDPSWDPNPNSVVYAIAVSGGDIYVGGSFTAINGTTPIARLAKLNNTTGAADASWNPKAGGTGDGVYSVAISGNDIYVAGSFFAVNSTGRRGAAKVNNTNGGLDTTWNAGLNNTVNTVIVSGSDVYLGGQFTLVNTTTTRNRIAKLNNTTGTADATWDPNSDGIVNTLVLDGNQLYVGGQFSTIGGQDRKSIARLNTTDGIADPMWNSQASDPVNSIAINGDNIYIGGDFGSFGGNKRNNLARLVNSTGVLDTDWDPNVNNFITEMVISGSDLYICGAFTSVNGTTTRNRAAKINLTTGIANPDWDPNANNQIDAIAADSTYIYIGGTFTTVSGGTTRNRLARIHKITGAVDPNWDPNANNYVGVITVEGNDIYVGGSFTTINGTTTRNRLARLNNTTGTADATWDPDVKGSGTSGTVYAIEVNGNDVYVGGNFITVNGTVTRNRFAKIHKTTGTVDANWNPNANNTGRTIFIDGNDVYVGGQFSTINGATAMSRLAKLNNTDGTADSTWNPSPNNTIYAITKQAAGFYIGGSFNVIAGTVQPCIALLREISTVPPVVLTGAVTLKGTTTATLNGTVNPNSLTTGAYFEYGTTTAYGMRTDTIDVGSGSSAVAVTKNLTGLTAGTLYHYRLVGFNSAGSANGADSVFTTLAQPLPTVVTLPADSVGIYSMRIKGTVNPNGDNTKYYFQYIVGSTISYTDTQSVGNGTSAVAVSKTLTGLFPNAGYSFKLFAFNSAGTASGTLLGATTLSPPKPLVSTGSPNPIGITSATVNGTINAQGDSTYWYFDYGLTTSYGSKTDTVYGGRLLTNSGVFKVISGLQPNTKYYYRLAAYNSSGLTNGGINNFTTKPRLLVLTSPVGGEGFEPGSSQNITWNAAVVDTMKIEYSSDNGNTWSVVIDNKLTTGGSYAWVVPSTGTTEGRIRLTSIGVTPEIVSNAAGLFTIAPSGLASQPTGTNGELNSNSFPDNNNGTTVGDSGNVANTSDGGTTWNPPASALENITNRNLNDVSTPSRFTRVAVGDSGVVYKSNNAGLSWSLVNTPTFQNYYAVSFTDTLTGSVVGGNGTILRTTNLGSSWVQQTSGTVKPLHDIYFSDASNATAVGEEGTVLFTSNSGSTWTAQNSTTLKNLNSVWFIKNAGLHQIGYAVGDSGVIIKTTNGGTTWNELLSPTSKQLNAVAFYTAERGTVVGNGGVVVYTTNGGSMWKSIVGTGSRDINSIAIPATGGAMFLAGSGGSMFKDTVGVVPVELTSFTASSTNGKVMLSWVTASELNNAGFDVERALAIPGASAPLSPRGEKVFTKIGEVTGKGTTTLTSEYIFVDDKAVTGKYIYRLKQRDFDGRYSYSPEVEAEVSAPMEFGLSQNYPNPFNPSTLIKYQLPEATNVLLEVYDIQGSLISRLVNGKQEAGYYSITFEAGKLPSGVYIYRLTAGKFSKTMKLMLMK